MWKVCVVALVGVAVAGMAAPIPKKPTPDFFPAVLGSRWEYALDGEKNVSLNAEVTKVTDEKGGRLVEVTHTDPSDGSSSVAVHRVDADGVFLASSEGEELSPPRLDLRAKPKAEDKWDGPHEWKGAKYALTTTIGGEEEVKVPAGTYKALPHVQTFALDGTKFPPRTTWYAPGVGMVKIATEGETALVLVKYTAGK